ncbi:MAG TPA: glycogen/starch synthase, partial [Planctomycetota bacterium]|nr:glycogen/starch synthase [Planctomycetota bacterium]
MNIVYVSSEVVPFSKTGGLADVAGSLPPEIARLGHTVSVMTPYYRAVKKIEPKPKVIGEGLAQVGPEQIPFTLYQSASGKNGHQVYFIGADQYFDRDGLYGTAKGDYEDSASRFIFFSRA